MAATPRLFRDAQLLAGRAETSSGRWVESDLVGFTLAAPAAPNDVRPPVSVLGLALTRRRRQPSRRPSGRIKTQRRNHAGGLDRTNPERARDSIRTWLTATAQRSHSTSRLIAKAEGLAADYLKVWGDSFPFTTSGDSALGRPGIASSASAPTAFAGPAIRRSAARDSVPPLRPGGRASSSPRGRRHRDDGRRTREHRGGILS